MWFRRRRPRLKPVPPDHPMFSGQVFFAFENELPEEPYITPAEEDEVELVSPRVPGRMLRGVPSEYADRQ
jgi:hypothetical protein